MKHTDETLSLALGISIYLGETIIKIIPICIGGIIQSQRTSFLPIDQLYWD